VRVSFRIVKDTTLRLDGMTPRLDKRIEGVAKRASGEMVRGAKRALGSPTPFAKRRVRHGRLRASITGKVQRKHACWYRAIAGVPRGSEGADYAAFVEYGTGPRGAAGARHYRIRYRWPWIAYSTPYIRPKFSNVLSWQPRGKGRKIGGMMRGGVETGQFWATGKKRRRVTFVGRVAVRWTRGMYPHPYLTPQPFRVKPKADRWIGEALRREWQGK
jgi:hypothetical protein